MLVSQTFAIVILSCPNIKDTVKYIIHYTVLFVTPFVKKIASP